MGLRRCGCPVRDLRRPRGHEVREPWETGSVPGKDPGSSVLPIRPTNRRGTIWTYLPPHRLRFTRDNTEHAPGTVVDIRLARRGPGTHVALEHSGLAGPAEVEDLHGGWSWALDSLTSFVERGKPISHQAWLASPRTPC